MKKLFYLLFLIILCFSLNIKINAEEIDCNSHPYACVACEYNTNYGKSTFFVYSDGFSVNIIKPSNKWGGSYLQPIYESYGMVSVDNFKLIEENKLFCPAFMFYNTGSIKNDGPIGSSSQMATSYNYHFKGGMEDKKISLADHFSNEKDLYDKESQSLSCSYTITSASSSSQIEAGTNNFVITIITDGKTIKYESDLYEVYGSDITADLFKDVNGNLLTDENCPTLYFNCMSPEGGLLEGKNTCSIFSKPNDYSKPISGNPNLTGDDIRKVTQLIDGTLYKYLLGSLKMPLSKLYGLPLNFTLQVGSNKNYVFENITANEELCSNTECLNNANYYAEKGLKNIRSYCNDIYESYANGTNDVYIDERMQECISFNKFYTQLVNEGIVNNLADYCGILSEDFVEKLSFFLNIIMIAGPILAILLGSVDFIKVIANGDADKEMKTAFKHFMIRVGSAALLFIIPLLLSFILNIFMANEGGYDPENPFCNVNDWSEQ